MDTSERHRKVRLWILGIAVLVVIGPASAQAPVGWMTGMSIGQSKTFDYSVGGPTANLDENGTAFRVFGGYTFMRNFGVAASYVDLGEIKANGPAFGGFTDTIKVSGFDLSAMGFLPVHRQVALFGMVGAFVWKQKVNYVDESGPWNYDESGMTMSYGVGANVDVTPAHTAGIHLEYQRFGKIGKDKNPSDSGHRYNRDMVSLGFVYRFH